MESMEIITTTMSFLSPYLIKSGEKFSESIGESLWTWIKTSFAKKGSKYRLPDLEDKDFQEKLEVLFQDRITSDKDFKNKIEFELKKIQENAKCANLQNIENKGKIQKQINIKDNHGNIQM